jgi:hypothetical protein
MCYVSLQCLERTNATLRNFAIVGTLLLFVPYTAYFWVSPRGVAGVALGFLPGALGVALLLTAGLTRHDCYLRMAPLSGSGLLALAAVVPFLAVILPAGEWQGFEARRALEAALGGPQQELYFRASLLPALLIVFRGRPIPALCCTTLLSVLWHARMFTLAPLPAWLLIGLVLGLGHFAWTWQVSHDRTLVWATAEHSLLLTVMSFFGLSQRHLLADQGRARPDSVALVQWEGIRYRCPPLAGGAPWSAACSFSLC